MKKWTHSELVDKAANWARGRHGVVLKEKGGTYENPDVLAFVGGFSTLIEVKVSRADFLRDKRKLPRAHDYLCIGNYRIYCAPKGLLTEDDIPETWGLLDVYPSGYIRMRTNIYNTFHNAIWWHDLSKKALLAERRMLYNSHFEN